MKKRTRSIISLLLAILMVISSTPFVRVQAADAGVDLSDGLLAHYDFEDASGTTVPNTADAAAYPAAISGSATVVDLEGITQPSRGLQLGSAAGGMQLTDIVNASTSSFSVSLWYKATATSSSNVNLVQAGTMDGSTGRTILILAPDSTYYTYLTGDSSNVKTAAITPTTWQHITVSYDQAASKVYFFVNGVADNADGVTLSGTALDTGDMIIGRHRNANEGQFNGFMDEVRVYNKALSAAEAAAIYENTRDAYSVPPVGDITLTVDATDVQRVIDSDSIFGINHRYAFNGYGSFDSANMQIKEDFLALYEDAGFGSIRYPGGTISNLFNWKTTIGPVEQRKNQIHGFYNNAGQGGIAPSFGLAEIGAFAEQVGSEMVYVYSLGRGNAQDAADLIEYLNAEVGTNPNGGIDWAAVRAENGHKAPYNVRYFEIGNEMQQAWSGSDGTASQGYWITSVAEGAEAAYIDGGTATFTQQYAVCEEDWNATASLSDGSANLVRYMRYANVNPKMDDGSGNIVDDPSFKAVNDGVSVYVGSAQWTVVDSFENSVASDTHVVIDYSTGAIRFGDGVNGAIPASGEQIYVSYSVERDGFIAISQAMRETIDAINKAEGAQHEINIYSSYESQGFITKMADRDANDLYDGLTIHPYSGTPDGTGETFYDSAMYKAEATGIANVQNYVNMMPADKVPVISEYGIFRSTDELVRSQTHAIYIAKVLMEYVRLGSPYIQKHCLVDWYSSGADSLGPTQQAVIQAVAGSDANTTTGEGTFTFFSTPSAHVFQMLNSAFADNVVATEFSTTPTMSNGAQTLSALASKDASGTVYLAIVNASRETDYELTLNLENFDMDGVTATAQVLTADSFDAQNSPDDPENVTVTTEAVTVDPENFTYTVPKHTFVILTIEPANAAPEPFSAAFADPYAKVGQPMTLEVKGASDDVTYSWTVDGAYVSSDASYTPTADDLMKWIRVTVTSGSDTATLEMFFSKLPVVYINTENGAQIVSKEDYINAELMIQGNETYNSDTTTLYDGATEIRGRGNSTWVQPKKPYKLKLDSKTDVFGMGKNKHWVLLANYMDESLLRNTLAYDLSGAMGMEHCSTVFVDVILNGEFIGNYQFCEQVRVDSTRVDVFDWEGFAEDSAAVIADAEGFDSGDLEEYMLENMGWITSGSVTFNGVTYTIADYPDIEIPSINGGYLLELDEYYDEISKFKTNSSQPIMFKNPEFVNTNADMMKYVQTYVQAFEDAVGADSYTAAYEGETVHYSDLYDFDSLVDYWLVGEIFFNEELNKKSTYMYKDIDGLMFMGPVWDMDWSSGGEGETYHTEQWATRYYSTNAQANSWYKYLIQDPYFFIKAQERYWEIRDAQVADMLTELDASYALLKESADANGERWGYGSDYETYVNDLRNWFNSHLTWLDAQMATQDTLRDSLGYYASSRLTLSLTDADGNALAADSAEHAPADGIAEEGQSLKLTITGGDNTTGNAVLYVNGRRASVTAITANSTITVDVPSDSLTAQAGEKNVLEVQIEAADGSINASRYVTVSTAAHTHVFDQQNTEAGFLASEATCTAAATYYYSCACGEKDTETFSYGDVGTHNYDNGVCTVCGEAEPITGVAENITTQTVYATLAEALAAAQEGETVKLLTETEERYVMVYPGITLDLNGHQVTADYVVGFNTAHIIDNAETGKLVTDAQNVILDEANGMVPVYTGDGYIFTKAGFGIEQDTTHSGEGIKIEAVAYPTNTEVVNLLKDGSSDENIQIVILLTWDAGEGTGSQRFVFTDEVVSQVYSSNDGTFAGYSKMFTMVITGFESITNLKADMALVSDTNVEYISTNGISVK